MVVRMSTGADGLTVWLSGELDHHAARTLREQIDAAIERSATKTMRLDFAGVTFMDSSGIGLIMGRFRLMQSRGGELRVINVPPRMKKLMLMAGLSQLKVIFEEAGEKNAN